jgi:O-antigen/teichoic acid export membrane protein
MKIREIWVMCNGPKYRYIAANILVSLASFARNLLFMKTLNLAALGQIALMQTLVMLIGFAQLGLINGAYIEYSAGDRATNRRIVNLLTVGVLCLVPIAVLIMLVVYLGGFHSNMLLSATLGIGLATGIATLASTWMNNLLVADNALAKSNTINIGAVGLSVVVALLSRPYGLKMALFSMFVQPLVVIVAALLSSPNLRPHSLRVDWGILRKVAELGWIPFLSMLMALGMHQIERWSIATILGTEALGRFYIVLMFTTFFALIPAALANVFFPQAKRAYRAGNAEIFQTTIRRHARDLFIYFALAIVITFTFMTHVVAYLMPGALQGASLVYYALIWLVLFSARDTASLVLFSTGRMRDLLVAGLLTLAVFVTEIAILWGTGRFSLTTDLLARGIATLPGTVLLYFGRRRQMKEYREQLVDSAAA